MNYKNTVLSIYPKKVTVSDLQDWMIVFDDNSKKELLNFIHHRFIHRYIKPLDSIPPGVKSGFLIMAAVCLIIETLETFYVGEENSKNKSRQRFENYFKREKNLFVGLESHYDEFYYNIRCGVLHQAETKSGYKILRKGKLFNPSEKSVNANLFLKAVNESIDNYKNKLSSCGKDSEIWINALKKLKYICDNCK